MQCILSIFHVESNLIYYVLSLCSLSHRPPLWFSLKHICVEYICKLCNLPPCTRAAISSLLALFRLSTHGSLTSVMDRAAEKHTTYNKNIRMWNTAVKAVLQQFSIVKNKKLGRRRKKQILKRMVKNETAEAEISLTAWIMAMQQRRKKGFPVAFCVCCGRCSS